MAADTEEFGRDAQSHQSRYEVLDFIVMKRRKAAPALVGGNAPKAGKIPRAMPAAYKAADAVVEGDYGIP